MRFVCLCCRNVCFPKQTLLSRRIGGERHRNIVAIICSNLRNYSFFQKNYLNFLIFLSSDQLYGRIGKRFYELITQEFGETTVFNSDIFNEMVPYS